MKSLLYLFLTLLLASSLVHAENLSLTPAGKEFLESVSSAIADTPPGVLAIDFRIQNAQRSIASLGPHADQMLVQILLETMDLDKPSGFDRSALPIGLSPNKLLYLITPDGTSSNKLIEPLLSWLNAASTAKFTEIDRSRTFIQAASLYVQRWGGAKGEARLREMMAHMEESSNPAISVSALSIQQGLLGSQHIDGVPQDYHSSLSQWCQSISTTNHSSQVTHIAQYHTSNNGAPSYGTNRSLGFWNQRASTLIWALAIGFILVASVAGYYLVRRKFTKRKTSE